MTTTQPLHPTDRLANYREQNGSAKVTARQYRRALKKAHKNGANTKARKTG
jgi:hypothetical protein